MQAAKKTDEVLDEFQAALAWHDGDAAATIRTLLADCSHLRSQLVTAQACISRGLTRGWMPVLEREFDGSR
ncbi:hypothetical protein [Rhizobium leguminosarum]